MREPASTTDVLNWLAPPSAPFVGSPPPAGVGQLVQSAAPARTRADQTAGAQAPTATPTPGSASGPATPPPGTQNIGAPNAADTTTGTAAPTTSSQFDSSSAGQALQDLQDFGLSGPDMQAALNWYSTEAAKPGMNASQLQIDMYQQPWFQKAFPGIIQQVKNGQSPMTPADYVAFKQGVLDFNRQFGVPDGFISDADIGNMVGRGWTFKDYTDRMGIAFNDSATALANDPQEIAELDKWYGLKPGSGGLAAFMLDPAKSQNLLEQATTAASAGAYAEKAGFTRLDQGTLMGLAAATTLDKIQAGVSSAVPLLPTTRATLGPGKSQATATERDLLASQVGGVPGETQEQAIQHEQVAAGARVQALGGGGGGVNQGQPGNPTGTGFGSQ